MEQEQVQTNDQATLGDNDAKQLTGGGDGRVEFKSSESIESTSTEETPKTFTQEDVNGIAAKEAKKAQEKLLKSLGVTDFNTAKEGLQKYNEMVESQKTDQQRKEEELTTYQTKAQQAEERASALESKLAALELNVNANDLEDVLVLAKAKNKEDIKEAIQEVIERYPHFTTQSAKDEAPATPKWTAGAHKKDSPDTDPFIAALLGKK